MGKSDAAKPIPTIEAGLNQQLGKTLRVLRSLSFHLGRPEKRDLALVISFAFVAAAVAVSIWERNLSGGAFTLAVLLLVTTPQGQKLLTNLERTIPSRGKRPGRKRLL